MVKSNKKVTVRPLGWRTEGGNARITKGGHAGTNEGGWRCLHVHKPDVPADAPDYKMRPPKKNAQQHASQHVNVNRANPHRRKPEVDPKN